MGIEAALIDRMMEYEAGCAQRVHHFLKVYQFADTIAALEGIDADTRATLAMAAITHDIGIKACLARYGTCTGEQQERIGPDLAREMLLSLAVEEKRIDRVCWLIAHHHTYDAIDGMDLQILIEADFLVNLYEAQMEEAEVRKAYEAYFRTETGKKYCRLLFAI